MALSLLAAPPPQFLGFGTGSSSSSTSPSWRSNGVLFCLDRLSRCWKKNKFLMFISVDILNCFLICVPLPLHNHVSPLGWPLQLPSLRSKTATLSVATNRWSFPHITVASRVASRLILRIFVAPARRNGLFMSVPSPPRNEMCVFHAETCKISTESSAAGISSAQ